MKYSFILVLLLISTSSWAIDVKSDAFASNGNIPVEYSCDGKDVSPAIAWSGVPANAKTFAVICEDPDASAKIWSHWVIFNIPKAKTSLPRNVEKSARLSDSSMQGLNDMGKTGYAGPCPSKGKPHHYYFRVYALDTNLNLDMNATRDTVLSAMQGHVLDEGRLIGIFGR